MPYIRKTHFVYGVLLAISCVDGWVCGLQFAFELRNNFKFHFLSGHTKLRSPIIRNMFTHQNVELTLPLPVTPLIWTITLNTWRTFIACICIRASFCYQKVETTTWNYSIEQLICADFSKTKDMSPYCRCFLNCLSLIRHTGFTLVRLRK